MNVLVNTYYLDTLSEFFYLISFSLSMWFGFTKKLNLGFLEVPSNSPMQHFFRNFTLIFYFFFFNRSSCSDFLLGSC